MSENEQKPVDSNKEAADLNCNFKISKCLTSGAKTAEEVEAALKCLKEQAATP